MPAVPMVAALSASHLAALVLPPGLKRLYIACDADRAGRRACERLTGRARTAGITVLPLHPRCGDFNDDLRAYGLEALVAALRAQIAQEDLACLAASECTEARGPKAQSLPGRNDDGRRHRQIASYDLVPTLNSN